MNLESLRSELLEQTNADVNADFEGIYLCLDLDGYHLRVWNATRCFDDQRAENDYYLQLRKEGTQAIPSRPVLCDLFVSSDELIERAILILKCYLPSRLLQVHDLPAEDDFEPPEFGKQLTDS